MPVIQIKELISLVSILVFLYALVGRTEHSLARLQLSEHTFFTVFLQVTTILLQKYINIYCFCLKCRFLFYYVNSVKNDRTFKPVLAVC